MLAPPPQVVVNLFGGLPPLCIPCTNVRHAHPESVVAAPAGSTTTSLSSPFLVRDLKSRLYDLLSIPPSEQRITAAGGRTLVDDRPLFHGDDGERHGSGDTSECDDDGVPSSPPLVTVSLLLRLRGGKGGFGSMLRAQGGKMASRKTTNNEACRDLSGRRLKTVNDAKKLADYIAQEPDRKRKAEEKLLAKIEKAMEEPVKKKHRFDDTEYVQDHEKVLEDVKDAVKQAMTSKKVDLKGKTKAVANATSSAKATASKPGPAVSSKLAMWDEDGLSDSDESDGEAEKRAAQPSGSGSGSESAVVNRSGISANRGSKAIPCSG